MFSKELEEVIEAALADGVITEKERAVLHKRAAAEGVDPDELDIVIDGRLAKIKKQEDWLRPVPPPQAPHNNKHGVVRKCPNCGAQVGAGSVKCSECGYEFAGIEANSSVTKLSEQLQKIEQRSSGGLFSNVAEMYGASKRLKEMATTISNFPVPTTKEDLLEFILYIQPKIKSSNASSYDRQNVIPNAYRQKYEECINKVKMFFGDDPQFQPLLEQYNKYKKQWWANLSPGIKGGLISAALLLLTLMVVLICVFF